MQYMSDLARWAEEHKDIIRPFMPVEEPGYMDKCKYYRCRVGNRSGQDRNNIKPVGGNMRVSEVRKKYPEFFAAIEAEVFFDVKDALKGTAIVPKIFRRIAYNAAAVATLELHKVLVACRKKPGR